MAGSSPSLSSDSHFDVVVVGSGIASTFFLERWLRREKAGRILVLEAGARFTHAQLLGATKALVEYSADHFVNKTPEKVWHFSRAFGGGTNCWFGSTPRMLPEDFKLKSRFAAGADWPLSYDDLEPFYVEVEKLMMISGDSDMPYRMSSPYPLPPHRFSEPDKALKAAYPREFFHLPTARSSRSQVRAACCGNAVCSLCPTDSKFTVANGLAAIYEHPAVTVRYAAPVTRLEHSGNTVSGVVYRQENNEVKVTADLVILGANALFNPHILLKSGLTHPQTGLGLCEQVGLTAMITLDGMKNFQGSTITTGLGFNDMFGEHRRERGGFLYHTVNRPRNISLVKGKEFSQLEVIVAVEDLRQEKNRVIAGDDDFRPVVHYEGHSDYAQRTVDQMEALLAKYLSPLPIERIRMRGLRPTESHIQGTTVMGEDPATSVVDRHCVHHAYRNLVVLGSGVFPTASPANPSLTIAALALASANHLAA